MNRSPLNTDLYEQIRLYAELIDQVLIDLKDGVGQTDSSSRIKLGRMLMDLEVTRKKELSARMIWLICDAAQLKSVEVRELGQSLSAAECSHDVVDTLEKLAGVLAHEQDVVISRIGTSLL